MRSQLFLKEKTLFLNNETLYDQKSKSFYDEQPSFYRHMAEFIKNNEIPIYKSPANIEAFHGLVCIVFFLLFNPFLSLFFLAIISVYYKIPKFVFFVSAVFSFTLIFYFRKYGIDANNVSDDTNVYLQMYNENKSIGFLDIFFRFLDYPNGNEPIYHLIWWPLIHFFNGSDKVFLFLHYSIIFSALFYSLNLLSKRYFVILILVFFFITPGVLDSLAFVWRQQLAFSVYLIGVCLYFSERKKMGLLFIYLSPLMHLSVIFFLFSFIMFQLYQSVVSFKKKVNFYIFIFLMYLIVTTAFGRIVMILDSYGVDRILNYFTSNEGDSFLKILSSLVYAILLLVSSIKYKNDLLNTFLIVSMMSVFIIMFSYPSASSIYSRFLAFILPFFGIYFYRLFLMNFSLKWHLTIVILVFLSGVFRIYRIYNFDGAGVVKLLAYDHAFDPFMGVIKMVLNFGIK